MNATTQAAVALIAEEIARKLSITDDDKKKVLADDVKDAAVDALDYCNRDDLAGNMSSAVKDLYYFRRNTEGVEGETSRSEGGVSQAFEVGIPKRIQTKLNRYRLANVRSL